MLNAEYLSGVTSGAANAFIAAEDDITADIARRIVKTNYITPSAAWQLDKARQMGMLQGDVAEILADATGMTKRQISRMMTDAGVESLALDGSIYQSVGISTTPISQSSQLRAVLKNGIDGTGKLVENFSKTTANTATKAFENSIDSAYLKVVSGAFSPNEAVKVAVDRLAKDGITNIAYPTGHNTSVEAAVQRAVRTGVGKTCAELQLAQMDELGTDLVEVTSHGGARPSHAAWQGQIYSRSGRNKNYPDFSNTHYGQGDGLCGWNCRHSFFPYLEGASTPTFKQYPIGKGPGEELYAKTQKLRSLERNVRSAKRELNTYENARDAADDPALKADFDAKAKAAKSKVTANQAKTAKYAKDNGLPREYGNEHIGKKPGTGTTPTSKPPIKTKPSTKVAPPKSSLADEAEKKRIAQELAEEQRNERYRQFEEQMNKNGIPPRMKAELRTAWSQASDRSQAKWLEHTGHGDERTVLDGYIHDGAYYSPSQKGIFMDFAQAENSPLGKIDTYLHEHGHYIDYDIGDGYKWQKPSCKKEFQEALEADYDAYIASVRKHVIDSMPAGTSEARIVDLVERQVLSDLRFDSTHSVQDIIKGINCSARRYDPYTIRPNWGHKVSYYQDEPTMTAVEAYAHMVIGQFNFDAYTELARFLPNALRVFEEGW